MRRLLSSQTNLGETKDNTQLCRRRTAIVVKANQSNSKFFAGCVPQRTHAKTLIRSSKQNSTNVSDNFYLCWRLPAKTGDADIMAESMKARRSTLVVTTLILLSPRSPTGKIVPPQLPKQNQRVPPMAGTTRVICWNSRRTQLAFVASIADWLNQNRRYDVIESLHNARS